MYCEISVENWLQHRNSGTALCVQEHMGSGKTPLAPAGPADDARAPSFCTEVSAPNCQSPIPAAVGSCGEDPSGCWHWPLLSVK